MFEESVTNTIPSIWASMNSWFTPAVFFVLLNVMIGTIVFTSTLANQKQHHNNRQQNSHQNDQTQQPTLARSPSVLQRLRSMNFYSYRSQDHPSSISTHFKTTPGESDTLYNFEQTHQPQESHSQFIFEQSHQEKQALFGQQMQDNHTHNYFFQQTYEENAQENRTHFVFQQAHEENAQENRTHLDFEQTHKENIAHENGTHLNFGQAREENIAQENGTHLDFEQAREENVESEELQSLDEVYSQLKERHVSRSKSDTKPAGGEIPARLPMKMKKSASTRSAFNHFEEDDIVEARRPVTVRERGAKVTEVDEEVDAKADDFINKFKQQLKLQRLESIIRYKDMISRGSGK